MEKTKGGTLLKVIGVISIIIGAFCTLLDAFALFGGVAIVGTEQLAGILPALGGGAAVVIGALVLNLIWSIITLLMGVYGVKFANVTEKANSCFLLGLLVVLLAIINGVVSFVSGGFTYTAVISLIISLLLPVLFSLGAKMNMKKA